MFKKLSSLGLSLVILFSTSLQVYAAADVVSFSDAWARNSVSNTDISTTGVNVDTAFALASDSENVEVSVMIRNTGDALSGAIELYRSGDPDGTFQAGTLEKYQTGTGWTVLTGTDWSNLNSVGTKLSLGTLAASSYVRIKYQINVGGSHTYGDILQDNLEIYEASALVKTLPVSIYVPYLEIQSANSGDDSIILNSAVDLLETSAETIGNFEVSSNGGTSFTTLTGPSTAVYLSSGTGRTITLTQSQVDFDGSDSIVVRLSNVKTADDLRFLNPSNFTIAGNVSTASVSATDTTSPTFTAGFDSIAGADGILFLTFDEPMDTSTIATANVLARTSFNNGHDLGTSPTVSWTSTSTVKIMLDNDGDAVAGDTVTLTSNVTDANGNAVDGSAVLITAVVLDAPTIDTFTIADQSSSDANYTNNRTIDVTGFTASDNDGIVTGYLVNESAATPVLSAINNVAAPATYTITGAEGAQTIYAWVKDDDDHITGTSTGIILDLTDPVVTANVASGNYNSARTVTLSFSAETNPGSIYYTLDGSTPDNTDTLYTVPLSINSDLTLNFIGYDAAENVSSVETRTYTFTCNPSSVSNGSVGAYPGCTITCNSGYVVSGSSCVIPSSGGGGGGGGKVVDTTTIYNLPTLSSDKTVKTYRPIQLSGNTFTRPVRQINYYIEAQAEFDLETELFDLENNTLSGSVIYPIGRIKASEAKTELRVPNPPQSLVYSRYYQFGSLEEQFSKEVSLAIPITSSVIKLGRDNFNIYQWIPSLNNATSDTDGVVYRSGEWKLLGDGNILDADTTLNLKTTTSTLFAFTKTGGEVVTENVTPFLDIVGHWAKQYIEGLYLKGIVNGKTETSFAPNDNLTRAELTKIALNSFDFEIPSNVTEKPFSDVTLDAWYVTFITKAKEAGVLAGYSDGTFRPNQPVNRAEALKILIEAAGIDTAGYEASFLDTDPNAWYAPYIAYAKQEGVVEGYAVKVSVPQIMSGSELVSIASLHSFATYFGKGAVGDDVKKLQEILILLGFLNGEINGEFDTATEEAVLQFQLDRGVVSSSKSIGAGYLGPSTLEKLFVEEIESKVDFKTETQYNFKPGQFITRAEIAKIAMKLIGD